MFRKFIFVIFCVFYFSFTSSAQEEENIALNNRIMKNTGITEKLALCGNENKEDACIFYAMNTDSQDHFAEDFFKVAANSTKRSDIIISENNLSYAKQVIPPGYFAEIKIPSNIIQAENIDFNTLVIKNPRARTANDSFEIISNHKWKSNNKFPPLCVQNSISVPCVLYVMNTTSHNMKATEFVKDISAIPFDHHFFESFNNNLTVPPGKFAEIVLIPKQGKELVRDYIMKRFEVYPKEELQRRIWFSDGFIYNTSTEEVYKEFIDKEAFGVLNLIEKEQLMRQVKILDLKEESPQNWSAIMEVNDTLSNTNEKYSSKWKLKIKLCDTLVCEFKREQYQEQEEISAKK